MLSFKQFIIEIAGHYKARYRSNRSSSSEKFARGKKGKHRSAAVRAAISRAMRGKSNFEGHHHTEQDKRRIADKRGHDDRIRGRRWVIDKKSGKTNRKYKLGDRQKFGRSR